MSAGTLTCAQLATLLLSFRHPRVLVVGDVMLDHYVFGRCERLSPEAPTPILRVEREENRPGGAGSVASMLRKLEAEVALVSAVGADAEGDELRTALERLGCDVSGIVRVDGRPTTVKTRMIAAVQHLLRVDREVDHAYASELDAALLSHAARLLPSCDVMLLSDYGRHVLLPEQDFENYQRPEPFIPASPGQQAEWIQCWNNCFEGCSSRPLARW